MSTTDTRTDAAEPAVTPALARELGRTIRTLRALTDDANSRTYRAPDSLDRDAALHYAASYGRVSAAAAIARDCLFDVLNTAATYTAADIPCVELAHGDPAELGVVVELDHSPVDDTIMLGYSVGSADTAHGRFHVVASGARVRFTLAGVAGYVDVSLAALADAAYTLLTRDRDAAGADEPSS